MIFFAKKLQISGQKFQKQTLVRESSLAKDFI